MTAHERTNWRDQNLSARHRLWGFDCPAIDLDFVLAEYDFGKPKALIDYKLRSSLDETPPASANLGTLARLGEMARLPAFIAYYRNTPRWQFRVFEINNIALGWLDQNGQLLDEDDYVRWLYRLRGREAPPHVLLKAS